MPGNLTHSPAEVIKNLLIKKGLASASAVTDWDARRAYSGSAWPAFADGEPDTPDRCVTVYDTAGAAHGKRMTDGESEESAGIQVRVRSDKHAAGWQKAQTIAVNLDSNVTYGDQVDIGTSVYNVYAVTRTGPVLQLGRDAPNSDRRLFTINALVRIRQVS